MPLIDGHEDIGGNSPLRGDWYWMHDDGNHTIADTTLTVVAP